MSRIGKKAIAIPDKVTVDWKDGTVTVKGPKGSLSRRYPSCVELVREDRLLSVHLAESAAAQGNLHGLTRTLVANMVAGVTEGFAKTLEVQGTGYKFTLPDKTSIQIDVGYSDPKIYHLPPGITAEVGEKNLTITVRGSDKELVGQVAANIRRVRPAEPYKGKGIRYKGEVIRMKAGKAGKAAGAA